jgi:heme O synthase-like polyprenyltransferase
MPAAMFSTPRPEPNHLLPAIGGTLVILLALPVFLIGGWSLSGWGLALAVWVATHAIDLLLNRTRGQTDNVAASGVQAFGLFFKSIGLLAVLLAAAVANRDLAIGAIVTYVLAYTFELGLSLATYFGGTTR